MLVTSLLAAGFGCCLLALHRAYRWRWVEAFGFQCLATIAMTIAFLLVR